jgi:hypothetical protein
MALKFKFYKKEFLNYKKENKYIYESIFLNNLYLLRPSKISIRLTGA